MHRTPLGLLIMVTLTLAACGSPAENAVTELIEQVRLGDPLASSTYANNQELLESSEVVALWVDTLANDESTAVKAWAAQILGAAQDTRALPALTAALGDAREVRDAAVDALMLFPVESAVSAFVNALESSSRDARAVSLAQLSRLQNADAVPAIVDVAYGDDALVAREALNTLGDLSDERAAMALAEYALDSENPMPMRLAAIVNLGRVQDTSALDQLDASINALQAEGANELADAAQKARSDLQGSLQ